jgi:NAD+ synthase (glutamine-hydrolysing)
MTRLQESNTGMNFHGFVRVATAAPSLKVADCDYNAQRILSFLKRAEGEQVSAVLFPELSLTGYTCGDLFHQPVLQKSVLTGLERIVEESSSLFSGVAVVGLPLLVEDRLFNTAVLIHAGQILGIIPKSYLPNYKEFYEERWFSPGQDLITRTIDVLGQKVPFGPKQLFEATDVEGLIIGVEICEDLWVPIPPSSYQAMHGATLLLNPSASNEIIGKAAYRRNLVISQSGRCIAGYVYAGCGVDESTTDVVFGGHGLIAENGVLQAESDRFQSKPDLLIADLDLERLRMERVRINSFAESKPMSFSRDAAVERGRNHPEEFLRVPFTLGRTGSPLPLYREIDPHPFVPRGKEQLRERCEEIFHSQITGLARRLAHVGDLDLTLGISGGLDSTLALLVTCKALDSLSRPRQRLLAFTLPGFGTTIRTLNNARALMKHLGVTAGEIDIRGLCLEEMRLLGHRPFGIDLAGLSVEDLTARLAQVPADQCHDLVFENVQTRKRTGLLMNRGFMIGTGDLSELALGWCTYGGDHMSMYNPNVSIPKTLVKFLVRWAAENEFEGETRKTLLDIVATTISPELLPAGVDGQGIQDTECTIGPYELHDFFLFHFLRYGAPPEKILFLAEHADFDRKYSPEEIRRWLRVFIQRFFSNQFKRSCLPDGPKVGTISLSPRSDWRMPSDAQATAWLQGTEPRSNPQSPKRDIEILPQR